MTTARRPAACTLGLVLVLAGSGCAKAPPVAPACIDSSTATVHVHVRNPGPGVLTVPQARPDVGCCRNGLTVALTDANGRDLDRCGFSDNFDTPEQLALKPGEAIAYRLSAATLSSAYCKVDVARQYVSVHDGVRSLGTHPLVPCGEASRR